MMRYVGFKYVEIWNRGDGGSDRGEGEFKDQPRLINRVGDTDNHSEVLFPQFLMVLDIASLPCL